MRIDPRHPETEALWRAVAGAGVRSIAVVAAGPGEGCSTVAEALWRRAACAGRSALLVDLNRDRPMLGARLGQAEPGMIQYVALDEQDMVGQAIALGVDRRRNAGALRVVGEGAVGHGRRRSDRAEDTAREATRGGSLGLLADPGAAAIESWRDAAQFRTAVEGWLTHWDTVVFDGAPVAEAQAQGLPGLAAAAAAEASVLVVLAGWTATSKVREARQALDKAGARLLGCVLNDRDNPSLRQELDRELRRLGRWLPRLAARLAGSLERSSLLGLRI